MRCRRAVRLLVVNELVREPQTVYGAGKTDSATIHSAKTDSATRDSAGTPSIAGTRGRVTRGGGTRGGERGRADVQNEPRLARHLSRCEVCREEALRLASEEMLIRAAFVDLPVSPDFTAGVLARIRGTWRPADDEAG